MDNPFSFAVEIEDGYLVRLVSNSDCQDENDIKF